jgi:hypothetical protein
MDCGEFRSALGRGLPPVQTMRVFKLGTNRLGGNFAWATVTTQVGPEFLLPANGTTQRLGRAAAQRPARPADSESWS